MNDRPENVEGVRIAVKAGRRNTVDARCRFCSKAVRGADAPELHGRLMKHLRNCCDEARAFIAENATP